MKKYITNILISLASGTVIFLIGRNYFFSLIGSVVIFLAFTIFFNKEEKKKDATPIEEVSIPEKIRLRDNELRKLISLIENQRIKEQLNSFTKKVEQVQEALLDKPDSAKALSQFANYYLVDLVEILTGFARTEKVYPENAEKIHEHIKILEDATTNLLKKIYADDTLAISVAMGVLEKKLGMDGLIDTQYNIRRERGQN